MPIDDVKLCWDALQAKTIQHTRRWNYYDGKHPLAFVNPKIGDVIKNGVVFKQNWCQVIINAARDRLCVQSWDHDDDPVSEAAADVWKKLLKKCQRQTHESTLATGEAYIIAWPGKDNKPRAYYHDPRQAHIIYEDEDPDTPRVACKVWKGKAANSKDQVMYLNLYYPNAIEHYVASSAEPSEASAFKVIAVDPNPYGVIPVFHFRLDRRVCVGELSEGVLSLQDVVNKLLNDMMVASEYSAFNQRWAIGQFDENSKITSGAGTLMKIPGSAAGDQPAQVGAFPATDPGNFLGPMDKVGNAIAILSATPKHFFFMQGGDPSGEALAAMEAPLVAKIQEYHETLSEAWTALMVFVLQIAETKIATEDLELIWRDPHTVQPQSQAITRQTNAAAGIPIVTQLRDEGWTEEQLEKMLGDMNSTMTMNTIPNPARLPANTPEPVRQKAAQDAKEDAAGRIEGNIASALDNAAQRGVEGMTKSGALKGVMDKFAGKKVRR